MIPYTHPTDTRFNPEIMRDPDCINNWFNAPDLAKARKCDLDYIARKHLDPASTFLSIQESMRFFVDIVADLVIAQYARGVSRYENNLYIVQHVNDTKGIQKCPWQDSYWSSGTETDITNKKTGVSLRVNYGTAHMAGAHWALEKGTNNPYSTSVESFLTNFSTIPEYIFSRQRWSFQHISDRKIFE